MSRMAAKRVLAIDPGSEKCGLAVVERAAEGCCRLIHREICAAESLVERALELRAEHRPDLMVMGRSAAGKAPAKRLREAVNGSGLLVVDEHGTTIAARERYWAHHPRRGWRRLLPATLQAPPVPVDDFAAVVIAERVLFDGRPDPC